MTDYLVDKDRHVGEVFPSLQYDGGLITSVLSETSDATTKLNIGGKILVQDNEIYDILEGIVMMPPTTKRVNFTQSNLQMILRFMMCLRWTYMMKITFL